MKTNKFAARYLVALLGIVALSECAVCQDQPGIDLIELRTLVGAENVDGSGVNLLQVEAGTAVIGANGNVLSRTYSPGTAGLQGGKTIVDLGTAPNNNTGIDGHARSVASDLCGFFPGRNPINQFGTAPAIGSSGNPPVNIISASEFINSQLGFGTPTVQTFDVSNHSYINNLDPANGFDEATAVDITSRLDYSINEGNTTTVVGSNNGNTATTLPALFVQSYNTINVGVTDGGHASGLTTLNSIAGRNSIHVVAEKTFTSNATAVVSGAAAILHQTGAGTDAVKQEVIKATILAGATKDDVGGTWSRTNTQPLDLVYGAGELNVLNNHLIQTGGEYNGGDTSGNPAIIQNINGWDYEADLQAGDDRFYEFSVGPNEVLENFSIALTWNREVLNTSRLARFGIFTPEYADLANLSLELIDVSDNSTVDLSNSSVDNVEHIFLPALPSGTYQLRVANGSTNVDTDYGLAFGGSVADVVLLGDVNLDGMVNFLDISPFIVLLSLNEYQIEADIDGNGIVNFLDISPFIVILSNQ